MSASVESASEVPNLVTAGTLRRWAASPAVAVAVVYVLLRLVQWVLSLPTVVGPDSHSFLPGPGLTGSPNGYVGFEKVSFTGDGAIRPWTVSLPYAVLLTDYFRSIAQLLVSTASFLFLAQSVRGAVSSARLGAVLGATVLVFSLSTLVTGWDMLLNRESLAISLTAVYAGILLRVLKERVPSTAVWAAGWGLLLLITRPTMAPVVLPLQIFAFAMIAMGPRRQSTGSARRPRRMAVLLGIPILVVMTFYPLAYSANLDASWDKWYGQTHSETQFGYVVSDYNPKAGELRAALTGSAPDCLIESIPVYTGDYVGAPWGFAAAMRESCPGFTEWYEENWPGWYYRYVATHPTYVAKLAVTGIPLALHPWDTTEAVSVLPLPLRDAFYPAVQGDEGLGTYEPFYLYWSVAIALIAIGLLGFGRRLKATVRHNRSLAVFVALLVLGSLASIVISLVLIPSYPLETNRVNITAAMTLRLLGPLMAIGLVWAAWPSVQTLWRRRMGGDEG